MLLQSYIGFECNLYTHTHLYIYLPGYKITIVCVPTYRLIDAGTGTGAGTLRLSTNILYFRRYDSMNPTLALLTYVHTLLTILGLVGAAGDGMVLLGI